MKRYLVEFVGTFLFVLAIALASASPLAALAIGLTLMALIYIGGHISGGHYNPAVTIGVYLRHKISLHSAIYYILAQFAGAVLAAITYSYLTVQAVGAGAGLKSYWFPHIGINKTVLSAITAEALLTFVFVSVILTVATTQRFASSWIYGFAIGLTLTAMIIAGAPISGGVFNPAVGLGTNLLANLLDDSRNMAYLFSSTPYIVYSIGPVLGAIGAGLFVNYLEAH